MADKISTPTAPVCLVCRLVPPQYICPKCSCQYCSLACYKVHSNQCTEQFYKESVEASLKGVRADPEESRRMARTLEALRSAYADDPTPLDLIALDNHDEEEEQLLLDLAKKLELGEEVDLGALGTVGADFARAVAAGDLAPLIQPWTPWWARKPSSKVSIEPLQPDTAPLESEEASTPLIAPVPRALAPMPAMGDLTKGPVSSLVLFSLPNLLYTYAAVMRVYNGDPWGDRPGAVATAMGLSTVLSANAVFQNESMAIQSAIERSLEKDLTLPLEASISIIHDVIQLLQSVEYVVAALSELGALFEAQPPSSPSPTKESPTKDSPKASSSDSTKKRAKKVGGGKEQRLAGRKVHFLTVWAHHSLDTQALGLLTAELKAEGEFQAKNMQGSDRKAEIRTTTAGGGAAQIPPAHTNRSTPNRPKIEELT